MDEIIERQLLIAGRVFAAFSTIEKTLTGCKKSFRGPHAACGPCVVQACITCCLQACWKFVPKFSCVQPARHCSDLYVSMGHVTWCFRTLSWMRSCLGRCSWQFPTALWSFSFLFPTPIIEILTQFNSLRRSSVEKKL